MFKKEVEHLDKEECRINVILYAAAGDSLACARVVNMLYDAAPQTQKSEIASWIRQMDHSLQLAAIFAGRPMMIHGGVDGRHALKRACRAGDADMAQRLLRAGADKHTQYDYKDSALTLASIGGHEQVVEMVLSRGADINWANHLGSSALLEASRVGHKDVVEMLQSRRADVGHRDCRGEACVDARFQKGGPRRDKNVAVERSRYQPE
eukprot:GEMP01085657.1.p1 GENE.GEMP01085657.1~~GEMP01085657.1.p1  ORF type:complete len:208 (+),score=40.43 GEMP01085657.1:235-858(+)